MSWRVLDSCHAVKKTVNDVKKGEVKMLNRIIHSDHVIEFLNAWLKEDPDAVTAFMETRVPCDRATAKHPSIQVSSQVNLNPPGVDYTVGPLGFLNGLFGTFEADDEGPLRFGVITMNVNSETGVIENFMRTEDALNKDGTAKDFVQESKAVQVGPADCPECGERMVFVNSVDHPGKTVEVCGPCDAKRRDRFIEKLGGAPAVDNTLKTVIADARNRELKGES
jgi:hypothetical protein